MGAKEQQRIGSLGSCSHFATYCVTASKSLWAPVSPTVQGRCWTPRALVSYSFHILSLVTESCKEGKGSERWWFGFQPDGAVLSREVLGAWHNTTLNPSSN